MKAKGFEEGFLKTVGRELADEIRDDITRLKMVLESKLRDYVHKKVKMDDKSDDRMAEKILMTVKRIRERTEDKSMLPGDISVFEDKSGQIAENAMMTKDGTLAFSASYMSRFNYDEIAFVVGHEMAHYKLSHTAAIPKLDRFIDTLGERMSYMRVQEHEADMLGVYYASKAGASFASCVSALRKLSNREDRVVNSFNYFSTHPTTAERVYYLRQNYSHDKAKRIVNERFYERAMRVSDVRSFSGLEIKAEMIRKMNLPRKDKEKVLDVCLKDMQEYMKNDPTKAQLQTYLDTKHVVNELSIIKRNPYKSEFMAEEIKFADALVKKVMSLPEVKKYKGFGVIKGAMQVRAQGNSKKQGKGM